MPIPVGDPVAGDQFALAPAWSRPRSRRSGCFPAEPYPPLRPLVVCPLIIVSIKYEEKTLDVSQRFQTCSLFLGGSFRQSGSTLTHSFKRRFEGMQFLRIQFREHSLHLPGMLAEAEAMRALPRADRATIRTPRSSALSTRLTRPFATRRSTAMLIECKSSDKMRWFRKGSLEVRDESNASSDPSRAFVISLLGVLIVTVDPNERLSTELSLFCHHRLVKSREIRGNQVRLKNGASDWLARGFVEFSCTC